MDQVSNYVAMRGRVRYQFNKTNGAPTSQSSFKLNDATLFYGGPLGKNYYAWFEFEREGDELGVNTYLGSLWGKENSFGGFRVGNLPRAQVGRRCGTGPARGHQPADAAGRHHHHGSLRIPPEELGLEGFYVLGHNRLSAQVLNGVGPDGEPHDPDTDTRKDVANDGRRRFVAGTLVPVGLPEYIKLTAEYWMDIAQVAAAPKTNHVVGEAQLVF